MDSKRSFFLAAGALLASGLGLFLSGGLHPNFWVMWIAPLPVLLAAPRLNWRLAFAAAVCAWFLGGMGLWNYLHGLLSIPALAVIWIFLAPAMVFGLIVLLYRRLVLLQRFLLAALVMPAAWAGYEYVVSLASPHSTFGSIAYSQMNFLPVLQIASVTGISGVVFSLMLFPAAIATLLLSRNAPRQRRDIALLAGGVLMLVLFFGVWRTHRPAEASGEVTVALVATDLSENQIADTREGSLRLLSDYAAQTEKLASEGAQAVVLPEKITVVKDEWLPGVDTMFLGVANRTNAAIIVGLIRIGDTTQYNEARIYLPGATSAATYEKHHMLPAFESKFVVGTARSVWPTPSGKWGVTICKDMDFPRLSREYAQDGAGLLLVPAWDFVADGWLHGRMAILRGVESGFSIARAPRDGILTATDDRGRVLAENSTRSAPFATVLAKLPVSDGPTFYSRHGDWFAWLCLAGLAYGIARLFK